MVSATIRAPTEWLIGVRGIKVLKYLVLRARMGLGAAPFTAINGLDRKLLEHLPAKGFFVEAGANDGIDQSNTFYLEAARGWAGILVEPVAELAALATRFRRATVINAALGGPDNAGSTIDMMFSDLVSSPVRSARPQRWGGLLGPNPERVSAKVRTLSEILDAANAPTVDLLSLDVEGYELPALAGLDLTRHRPRFILIETQRPDAVAAALVGYVMIERLSHHDYLFADAAAGGAGG